MCIALAVTKQPPPARMAGEASHAPTDGKRPNRAGQAMQSMQSGREWVEWGSDGHREEGGSCPEWGGFNSNLHAESGPLSLA